MSGPLDGIRVIDCTRGFAGTKATGLFADYGADVIWAEPPGGDPWREQLAVPYSVFNRSKRSIELDLRDDADKATLLDLVATADVFVASWRPGVADRLGLGYDDLKARNPGLVYCSISGYGPDAPSPELRGYESLVHAVAGTMGEQLGFREGPKYIAIPAASHGAAYLAVINTIAALYRREHGGGGHHIETSLLDGVLAYLRINWGYSGESPAGYQVWMARRMVARSYRCADGEYIGVSTMAAGAFERFITALGLDDRIPVETPEALLTPEQQDLVFNHIPVLFESEPRKVWVERLVEADVCVMPVLRPGEVFDEPQTVHNKLVVDVVDPVLGKLQQVAPPATMSGTPARVGSGAPTPGQHTQELRAELAQARPVARSAGPGDSGGGLLEGAKILDLGHWYAAPYCARLLADLGADVIKLEPIGGDPMRPYERAFAAAQAGKRAIAIDLKHAEAKPLIEKLLGWADVVQHNFRTGVAESLGLGYEHARAANPNVVYLHIAGFGSTGPDAQRQSLAPMMSGYVGAAYEAAGEFNAPMSPVSHEDSTAGLFVAASVAMALLHQKRTGSGQVVEVPMLHSALSDMAHVVRRPDGTVLGTAGLDTLQMGVSPLDRLYQTSDGWLVLVALRDDEIAAVGRVLDVDLLGDPQFASLAAGTESAYELEMLIAGWAAERTTEDAVTALRNQGVPAAAPLTGANVPTMDDERNHRNQRVIEFDHPTYGRTRELGTLVRVDGGPIAKPRHAPLLGEHGADIAEQLGFTADEVQRLLAARVIA